jgi:hypothetical protein
VADGEGAMGLSPTILKPSKVIFGVQAEKVSLFVEIGQPNLTDPSVTISSTIS